MFVILDLEWNINSKKNKTPKDNIALGLKEEIIEIGAWIIDEHLIILDYFETYIKAKYILDMHSHVSLVTGRDTNSLKEGIDFPIAINIFKQWCSEISMGRPLLFCTWSNNDLRPWISNLKQYNISWPADIKFLDAQKLYSLMSNKGKQQLSVQKAITELNIGNILPLHKAINDAWYTALIFIQTIKNLQYQSILPQDYKQLFNKLSRYSHDINLNYKSKFKLDNIDNIKELPNVAKNTNWLCPACNKVLYIGPHWQIFRGGQKIINQARCLKHGHVTIKVNCLKKNIHNEKLSQFQVRAELKVHGFRDTL